MPNRAMRLAPAPSAENGKRDGFVIALDDLRNAA